MKSIILPSGLDLYPGLNVVVVVVVVVVVLFLPLLLFGCWVVVVVA